MERYYQKEIECASQEQIRSWQDERLVRQVRHVWDNVPYYRAKMEAAHVAPDDIKGRDDLYKLPFLSKADLREAYPFGLLAEPLEKCIRIHSTSGTTGKRVVAFYTKEDIDLWNDCCARALAAAGAGPEDVCQVAYGYGLFTGALGLHYGLEKLGATVIPASSGNTAKQLMMFRDFGVTGLVATPSYALYLGEAMKEAGYPMEQYKLRIGLLGSETCTPEMRTQIENSMGIFVSDNYGMTELGGPGVSGECGLRCGLHFAEDHFLPEIIDPDTLEHKAPGEAGELVVTTLTREGMPVLRYRTKDITRLNYEPCACGRTHVRMEKCMGRTDDMLIIKGVNVFPTQIESVLVGMANVGPHYQLVVRRRNFMDNLEVKVELLNGDLLENYRVLEALQKSVHDRLKSVLGLETRVTLVEPKSLERFQGKAKRILDLRNQPEESSRL